MTTHNFKDQLAWSESGSDEAFWEKAYRTAFPNFVQFMQTTGDTDSQRMGIDRVVALSNGVYLEIDEKKRAVDYGDILLEYVSVDTRNAPGWIEKDLQIDFLSYAVMPTKTVYILPWLALRRAWLLNREEWMKKAQAERDGFSLRAAQNRTYKTLNIAVPREVLFAAITDATIVRVGAAPTPAPTWGARLKAAVAVPACAPLSTQAPQSEAAAAKTKRAGRRISNFDELVELWPNVLMRVRKRISIPAVSYLADARPVDLTPDAVVLQFSKEFHHAKAVDALGRMPFEEVIGTTLDKPRRLKFVLVPSQKDAPPVVAMATDDGSDVFAAVPGGDLASYAQSVFGADIVARSREVVT